MKHTWYVTFEIPRSGMLVRRRSPRLTTAFETEAAAKIFARAKFDEGLVVTAGTINPSFPRKAIPSDEIPSWLGHQQGFAVPSDAHEYTSSTK
jgi:hypothetical protein